MYEPNHPWAQAIGAILLIIGTVATVEYRSQDRPVAPEPTKEEQFEWCRRHLVGECYREADYLKWLESTHPEEARRLAPSPVGEGR